MNAIRLSRILALTDYVVRELGKPQVLWIPDRR